MVKQTVKAGLVGLSMLALAGVAGAAPPKQATPKATAFPANVTHFDSKYNEVTEMKGDLKNGAPMEDLSWAANSSNACWPATQNVHFRGNHVLFSTNIPPKSDMHITVVPDDPKQDMSIYAYTIGTTNFAVPPSLPSCVSCEAEQKWDRPKKGKTQDHTRTIRLNAATNPYNVVIGITGPAEAKEGGFTIKVDLKTGSK